MTTVEAENGVIRHTVMASSESQATRGPIVYGQIVNSQTGIPEIQGKVSERMKRRIKRKKKSEAQQRAWTKMRLT